MNNILNLAYLIDSNMKEFIFKNPIDKNQEHCEKYVLDKIMRATMGHLNPVLAMQMIKLHRKPMEEAGFCLQC